MILKEVIIEGEKAQRKVRRHMGLQVDEEDSPSPPPPALISQIGTILPLGWPTVTPAGVRIPPPLLPAPLHHHINPTGPPPAPIPLPASFFNPSSQGSVNFAHVQHHSPLAAGSQSVESNKGRIGFNSNSTSDESARKYTVKSFLGVEDEHKNNKDDNIIHPIRRSPITDVVHSQTASTNSNKRQFDVCISIRTSSAKNKRPSCCRGGGRYFFRPDTQVFLKQMKNTGQILIRNSLEIWGMVKTSNEKKWTRMMMMEITPIILLMISAVSLISELFRNMRT